MMYKWNWYNIVNYISLKLERKKNKTYIYVFIATLFLIAKKWKQSKRPSTDEQVNKMWYYLDSGASLSNNREWSPSLGYNRCIYMVCTEGKSRQKAVHQSLWGWGVIAHEWRVSFDMIIVLELGVIALWTWEYTELYTLNRWTALYMSHILRQKGIQSTPNTEDRAPEMKRNQSKRTEMKNK